RAARDACSRCWHFRNCVIRLCAVGARKTYLFCERPFASLFSQLQTLRTANRLQLGATFKRTNSSSRNRVAHKTKKFTAGFRPFALPGFLQRLPRIDTAQVDQLECAFDFISLLPGKPGATKSDRIQSKNIVVLGRNNERRNVFAEGGGALRDDQPTDAHILMENATTAEEGLIVHNHIAAQQHIVRDDHLVADNAVVSDMRIDHEKIIIS